MVASSAGVGSSHRPLAGRPSLQLPARLVASPDLALLLHSPDLIGVEVGEGAAQAARVENDPERRQPAGDFAPVGRAFLNHGRLLGRHGGRRRGSTLKLLKGEPGVAAGTPVSSLRVNSRTSALHDKTWYGRTT